MASNGSCMPSISNTAKEVRVMEFFEEMPRPVLEDQLSCALRGWLDEVRHPASCMSRQEVIQELHDMILQESDFTIELVEKEKK